MIPGTKSSLYVEEFFEFSDKLSGPNKNRVKKENSHKIAKHCWMRLVGGRM